MTTSVTFLAPHAVAQLRWMWTRKIHSTHLLLHGPEQSAEGPRIPGVVDKRAIDFVTDPQRVIDPWVVTPASG